jgi:hypothetical protein
MILRWKFHPSLLGLIIIFLMAFPGFAQTPKNNSNQPSNNKPKANENTKTLITPASTYKEVCGQCHLAYPPEFLPTGSWIKLLESGKNHFGNPLDFDLRTNNILVQYLTENGAEKSGDKISSKIMDSLEEQTPLRLTEVPYILKKHRKISPEVLQRKSVGSLAKCEACHRSAPDGIFSKKISIPE